MSPVRPSGSGKVESAVSLSDGNGGGVYREFSSVYVLPAVVLTPMLIYSPFTAADGKIPLSMVQVKSKPLYVVFSSQLPG